ncbi:MAG: acyltransferase [Bacteroidota bacterium]
MLAKIFNKINTYFIAKSINEKNRVKLNHIKIKENSTIDINKIHIRNPIDNKEYLSIGENSLIESTIIFEIESGKISIGDRCYIGQSTLISINEIEIENDVMVSWGCTIADNDAHSINSKERANDVLEWKKGIDENKIGKYKNWLNVKNKKILIKKNAWIGFNSIILKGVTIGEGAIVAAGSVVTKDVADYTVVAGNPAKFVKNTK